MSKEWNCECKDCGKPFSYSDTKYQSGRVRGWSRPERCDACRADHAREINSIGQAYYKVRTLRPISDPRQLTSDLGRFDRADRPHEEVETSPPPIDESKFGIKDDRLIEMLDFFVQDPGLQVVVVVGPTGSGKSTYFPYRLIDLPENYKDLAGNVQTKYWSVPIETDSDLEDATKAVKHTPLAKGLRRHYTTRPSDVRSSKHKVKAIDRKMFFRYGQIVVTQPRIQATRGIPKYIAEAMAGCRLGAGFDVGFRHSGSPNSDWNSKLAFVTDGTLINWITRGEIDKINTVMIDEAHERSLNIDIIIGLLTQMLPRHPRLKLIISSATISGEKFINHFNEKLPKRHDPAGNLLPNCRLIEFEGKSFKVSVHFRSADQPPLDYYREPVQNVAPGKPTWEGRYREPRKIFEQVAERTVQILEAMHDTSPDGGYITVRSGSREEKIDVTERQGDVLAFLHGKKPILSCCERIEAIAGKSMGDQFNLRVLPLYTTLKQKQQDQALKERRQAHDLLFDRIVHLLAEIEEGSKPRGDVLAMLNNAGQIHNLCERLESHLDTALAKVQEVRFYPWFTPDTARQIFGENSERLTLNLSPPAPGLIRVVISTSRRRAELAEDEFSHILEPRSEERRVVVSTNVAETSLTIHGILHVVDSGLINQNNWDRVTQTSSVSPILQSRAGCKQRWGRAGRLQSGDAWPLYTEAQFGSEEGEDDDNPERCFTFYSLPEISRSPLEQVLLTAKKAGVTSLDPERFPWLDAPDLRELSRAARSLAMKGALDADGDLTEHGLELSNFRLDARVGNLIVVADQFACAIEMTTAVAVATKGLKSLFAFDRNWDEGTIGSVRRRQTSTLSGCRDDLDAALKLMACWDEAYAAGIAFAGMVKLLIEGDGFSEALREKISKNDRNSQALLRTLQRSLLEVEVNAASEKLLRKVRNWNRRRELKDAIESAFFIDKSFQRLAPAWRMIVRQWSWQKIWEEGVLCPILGKRLLRSSDSEELPERVEKALPKLLKNLRNALPRGEKACIGCCDKIAKELNHWLKPAKKRPQRQVLYALAILSDPEILERPDLVVDRLMSLGRGTRAAVEKVVLEAFDRLPDASAKAWARANYLLPDAFPEVDALRAELLQSLEAHKKGEETRPLDLSRNDRLRALFAHCLPDNCYARTADGKYHSVVAVEEKVSEPIHVEMSPESLCASDAPDLFVCVERRAGTVPAGADPKLFTSFAVALPANWIDEISAESNGLHQRSTVEVTKFVAEHCHRSSMTGSNLLLDQIFPRGALCKATLNERTAAGSWKVNVSEPVDLPGPIILRFKKASVEEAAKPDVEAEIPSSRNAPKDLALTSEQRSIRAGEAIEESDKGKIDARQWESLFGSPESIRGGECDTGEVAVADLATQLRWHFDCQQGFLSSSSELEVGDTVEAEVEKLISTTGDDQVLQLKHRTTKGDPGKIHRKITPADIGCEFNLVVIGLERLHLGAGFLLIAREERSGIEVQMGPRDLSFSSCGLVPELVAKEMPIGHRFAATLVQIDQVSRSIRMTTHHVFEKLFPDPHAVTGAQLCKVIQHGPSGSFVRVDTEHSPEELGFVLTAMSSGDELGHVELGSEHTIHLSLPRRTRESWPQDAVVPESLSDGSERGQDSVVFRGVVSLPDTTEWLNVARNHRGARAAIYSLYERSHQLNGMNEVEYRRLESCVGNECVGRIVEINQSGIQLEITDPANVSGWMLAEEFSWFYVERHDQESVGQAMTVIGIDVDVAGGKVIVSRRQLTANPYSLCKVGQVCRATVCAIPNKDGMEMAVKVSVNYQGATHQIEGLKGWMFSDGRACLPRGDIETTFSVGSTMDATITAVREDKLILSAIPNILEQFKQTVLKKRISGTVVRIQKAPDGEEKGAEVEIAPGILAWLDRFQVATREIRSIEEEIKLGQSTEFLLTSIDSGTRDRGYLSRAKVSRKQLLQSAANIAKLESQISRAHSALARELEFLSKQQEFLTGQRANYTKLRDRSDASSIKVSGWIRETEEKIASATSKITKVTAEVGDIRASISQQEQWLAEEREKSR